MSVLDLEPAPRSFGDARAEHLATRRAAGLFDFSFMGLYEFSGSDALEPLQSRNLARFAPGRIAYTLLVNEDGSVFNDATVWRLDAGRWWLFTGRRSDSAWISARTAARERSGEHAVLALQGPASATILARLIGERAVRGLAYFSFLDAAPAGMPVRIARLGYSGELGYELIVAAHDARAAWQALLEAGRGHHLCECGFDAADSLRIESGYVRFGREITGGENPFELGLGRLVERPCGRRAEDPARRLVGLEIAPRPPLAGLRPWLPCARVTSECDSPLFGRRLALGFVESGEARTGTLVRLADARLARVARLPFYDPPRRLPRAMPL